MTVSSTQSSCDHTQKTVFYACNNTNEYEVSYTYSLLFPPLCHRTVCRCVVRRLGQNTIAISYHKINDVIIKKEELKSSRLFDDFLTCTYIHLPTHTGKQTPLPEWTAVCTTASERTKYAIRTSEYCRIHARSSYSIL